MTTPSPDHGVSALAMQVNVTLQEPLLRPRSHSNTVTTKRPAKVKRFESNNVPPLYASMQTLVQQMLHSDHGVPIRSYKRRLISAVPSAFAGADMVVWIMKNLATESKAEAVHLGSMLIRHGYFFCVEGLGIHLRDDNTLYRFQTPYYWPSQLPSTSDFDYGVYLVKQVLRSKHRIRLLDYELNYLHKLKLRLAKEWRMVTEKAEEDVKVFREQKRVAKTIIGSQEEAFWRLHRPPPGESSVGDSLLSRHGTERPQWHPQDRSVKNLKRSVEFLKAYSKKPRVHMSTALEGMSTFCQKYADFDPMLTSPQPGNPWVLGDDSLWTMERSYQEQPAERQVKKWACSFLDLLTDVTGRYKFEQFCKAQFNSENIRFWQACRDLKSIPYSAVEGSVKLIYDEFLQHGASSEVNVSANVQEDIDKDLKTPTRYAYSSAQEQIFQLMQNDIYPRFIKSPEYQELLKLAKEHGIGGKGFFSKLKAQSYTRRYHYQPNQPLDFTTPCLPDRFAKKKLSISRKLSSGRNSGSLDDLYIGPSANGPQKESKRISAYTEDFINALVQPDPEKVKQRRVSAPTAPGRILGLPREGSLEDVFEEGNATVVIQAVLEPGMSMSYSADDLKQLQEDADLIGPSKYSRFGPTEVVQDENSLAVNSSIAVSRSIPFKLSDQKNDLLQLPNFGLSSSPKVQSFEAESLVRKNVFSSNESVNSASSVS